MKLQGLCPCTSDFVNKEKKNPKTKQKIQKWTLQISDPCDTREVCDFDLIKSLRQNITPQTLVCLPLWMQISFVAIFKNHVDLEWESSPRQFTNLFLAEIELIFSVDMKEVLHALKWLSVDPVAQGLESQPN